MGGWTVAKIVASWKKFTARGICDYLKTENANQEIGVPGMVNPEIGAPGDTPGNANLLIGETPKPIWHREYWDRFIRNDSHFRQAVEYIHYNPVKAGLAARADEWPWSSALAMYQEADQEIGGPSGRSCPT
jgi:REP element-mobilizing transposase RayT